MKTAKATIGDVVMRMPKEYLNQQTSLDSVFEGVPVDMVDIDALIEANRTGKVSWYKYEDCERGQCLHILVPTELIEWED